MAFLLHQLLSESAARHPERVAIIFKDRTITYAELESASNRLANRLIALGVKKGDRVGIHMNRGIDSITAAFGIMKAGGTYVPIDPMSPYGRIRYVVTKCAIRILLTLQAKLKNIKEAFPENSPLESIIVMDGLPQNPGPVGGSIVINWQSLSDKFDGNAPNVNIIDSDLAYILFTSGSTGNPKGVMISHLNSLTFVNSACDFFKFREEDRFSNICPLHFDMSVFDIYAAVKSACSVVIIPESDAPFSVKLAEHIARKKITVWNSVPSALTLLANLSNLDTFDFSSLRLVLFAGEIFPVKYLCRLQKYMPEARFCNMYGQTEANSSTCYWVERLDPDRTSPLPIGKPLPNFDVFALDEDGRKVELPGREGELHVRASSVAAGYWGDVEKTEKSFVKDPLNQNSSEVVYRTGDLVRLDPDGNYVFAGRRDHLIKSRGYRIEIGEIETVLLNNPQIENAVVVPIPDELVGNRIAAIVIPSASNPIEKSGVLQHCAKFLPKYMIPEIVEFRDSLPKTSSGKVDRKKLEGLQWGSV